MIGHCKNRKSQKIRKRKEDTIHNLHNIDCFLR